jgi:NADH:ubiquinone oxidoreductase subunit F (NADH-binding)
VLVRFFKTESCGKCTPCRVGTRQMLEALERLRKGGYARAADLERLEEIANYVRNPSFCGLGQAAPGPILTGLQYFREEFEARWGTSN